jgi:hypothetical protein
MELMDDGCESWIFISFLMLTNYTPIIFSLLHYLLDVPDHW